MATSLISNLIALEEAGNPMSGLLMIVVLIVVFYFFMIRPQQKRQKQIREQRAALREGDSVVTAGGIYGKITAVKDTTFIISVADGVKIKVDKNSVYPGPEDLPGDNK